MQVDLSSDFFDLFGLDQQFVIEGDALVARFQSLQKQLHPDRFAAMSDAEKRWSMQAASHVNEGYQTLRNDLKRAVYLLKLKNVSIDDETDTQMSPMFLMEQMECREALESAGSASDPLVALDAVRQQLKSGIQEQINDFSSAVEKKDWIAARNTVRQWQFLEKLAREVKITEEQLED